MGLLDDLRRDRGDDPLAALSYNAVLDDVREALRNPTDEQVRLIAWRAQRQQGWNGTLENRVRAVLAAAAGGDDE